MQDKRLGSLFDGSGGFPLAASLCGIEPVWASEVEPYPIAVTRSRFPTMKHLGDISKVNGAEIEPVDVITFGSPCQDLSVAGKRAGLKHEANGDDETTRSGLFMEAVRIIKEMREATNGKYPTFALWENVPGAFSSNKGEDFRIVLEELIKIVEPTAVMPAVPKKGWAYADSYIGDGWSIAYRVFDAQYWGVPQRRRRIHLVLDLRGERAGEVLFKREGVRGYFAESGSPWQETAGDAESGVEADDREGEAPGAVGVDLYNQRLTDSVSKSMTASASDADHVPCVMFPHTVRSSCDGTDDREGVGIINAIGGNAENYQISDSLPTLTNGNAPGFMNAVCYGIDHAITTGGNCTAQGPCVYQDVQATLKASGAHAVCYGVTTKGNGDTFISEERHTSLSTGGGQAGQGYPCAMVPDTIVVDQDCEPAVAYALDQQGGKGGANYAEEVMPTLCSDSHGTPHAVAYPVPYTLKIRSGCEGGGKGALIQTNMSATLATNNDQYLFQAVTYDARGNGDGNTTNTITGDHENRITDYSSLIVYWDGNQTCGTLTANNAGGNQRMPDKDNFNCVIQADEQPIAIDRAFFNQGQNAQYDPQYFTDGTNPTLVARGPSAVAVRYIVRRLTPIECARLQGFADQWGDIEQKHKFTEEEYQFWLEVRNTHAAINGKVVKDYTKKQMLTWYNKLHTDSAEYKMWGNGIALPPALYCMQGIKDALEGR